MVRYFRFTIYTVNTSYTISSLNLDIIQLFNRLDVQLVSNSILNVSIPAYHHVLDAFIKGLLPVYCKPHGASTEPSAYTPESDNPG